MAAVTIEDRVRERMEQERAELTQKLEEARRARAEAGEQYNQADDACRELGDRLIALADETPDEVSKEQRDEVEAAHKKVMRALAAAVTHGNKVREIVAALEKLDAEGEYERRMQEAEQYAEVRAAGRKTSGKDAAIAILLSEGAPLHYREITKRAQDSGLVVLKGATPEATMNAMLAVAAKKGETFTKVGPGVFGLLDPEAARSSLRGAAAEVANNNNSGGNHAAAAAETAAEPAEEAKPEEPKGEAKRDRSAAAKKAAETRARKKAEAEAADAEQG